MKELFFEIFFRIRAAILILVWGDLVNGKIRHMEKAVNELDYLILHWAELSKPEIYDLLTNPTPKKWDTGLTHHVRSALAFSSAWRYLNAQARETRWLQHRIDMWSAVKEHRVVALILKHGSLDTLKKAIQSLPDERKKELRGLCDEQEN